MRDGLNMQEFVTALKINIDKNSEEFQNGNIINGMNTLIKNIEDINTVTEIVASPDFFQDDEINVKTINEKLNAILGAMENEDYILVGDLFQYEFKPLLDRVLKRM